MDAAPKSTADESDALTLWQRRLGLLVVLLTLPMMSAIIEAGTGLRYLMRERNGIPALPMTDILIATGSFLSSYWYTVGIVFVGGYVFWISKRTVRLLWFNAVVSVVFLVVVGVSMDTFLHQQRLLQEMQSDKNRKINVLENPKFLKPNR